MRLPLLFLPYRAWLIFAGIWLTVAGALYGGSIHFYPHGIAAAIPWAFDWTVGKEDLTSAFGFVPYLPEASMRGVLAIISVPLILLFAVRVYSAPARISPYLHEPGRLGDVIAAIQALATYKFYKLSHEDWADRIAADKTQSEKWKRVFEQHPEFFRLDSAREKASLVWRRQFPKRYEVDLVRVLTNSEYEALTEAQKLRVSRVALPAADIKTLVDTAVNLHSRALEHQKDRRWWVALASAVGGLVGSIVGAMLKS